MLWAYEQAVIDEINSNNTNQTYLKDILLNKSLKATGDLHRIADADIIVNTIPTQYIRGTFADKQIRIADKLLINGSKGIEKGTLLRISQIFEESLSINPNDYVVISGPSHAEEVARKMPTAVVAASDNSTNAQTVQNLFTTPEFRVYTSDDVIGAEIGGSLKNVMAIAAGIIDGLGLGDNTKAALITRAIAELVRLGVSCGAKPWTFTGLSGLGDLFVTCNSRHSRNRLVGELIGAGKKLDDIISSMRMVAEGVVTTDSALHLGKLHKVEMPISEQVYRILFEGLDPRTAIQELMTRESKHEWSW